MVSQDYRRHASPWQLTWPPPYAGYWWMPSAHPPSIAQIDAATHGPAATPAIAALVRDVLGHEPRAHCYWLNWERYRRRLHEIIDREIVGSLRSLGWPVDAERLTLLRCAWEIGLRAAYDASYEAAGWREGDVL